MSDQFVYFIQADENGPIKIGFTSDDPKRRLNQLQTGNASTLKLLGAINGSAAREREFHSQLAEFRLQGEWFEAHPTVVEAVNEALSTPAKKSCGGLHCSFCGACQHDRAILIAGPNDVFICNDCCSLCSEIIAEKFLKDAQITIPIAPEMMGYGG